MSPLRVKALYTGKRAHGVLWKRIAGTRRYLAADMLREVKTILSDRTLIVSATLIFAVGILLAILSPAQSAAILLRWFGIAAFGVFAIRRRTITPWIFFAMIAGAELGFDAPRFAVGLRVF